MFKIYGDFLTMVKMSNKQKSTLFKILISLGFFAAAIVASCFETLMNTNFKTTPIFLITAYLIAGHDIILKTIKNTMSFNLFDENFLMCAATLGAFFLNELFEAVTIILLYQIGEFFQNVAIYYSKNSVKSLLNLKPQFVNLKTINGIVKTKPELIKLSSTIVVLPGEQIPIDGIIVSGTSELNTASITGEHKPSRVKPGDEVLSGCVNLTSKLEIKTTKLFQNSTIKQMLNLIEKAKQKKANSEKFITKFAKIYTPIVVFAALTIATVPALVFNENWATWLQNAIVLLSVSCPCALIISVPLSFFGAISATAKKAVLIKTSHVIEKIGKIRTIVFDKTGTLTLGKFEIVEINPKNIDKTELINILNAAESLTNHPIATAIKSEFKNLNFNTNNLLNFEEFPGLGVKATTKNSATLLAGNEELMKKFKINYEKNETTGTVIYIAKNEAYVGNVVLCDKIKPEAKQAIQKLRELNFKNVVMLTGDGKEIATKTAKILNCNSSFHKQLPQDKVNKIEKMQKNSPIIFVGDGINDSPALAAADVGIAMGKFGADIAIESADIILIDNNLNKITDTIKIARKTMTIVKQNIIISILIKILILAAGLAGKANIWLAIFSDVGVSTLAVANALRTLKTK